MSAAEFHPQRISDINPASKAIGEQQIAEARVLAEAASIIDAIDLFGGDE